jgi:hypothetical protein
MRGFEESSCALTFMHWREYVWQSKATATRTYLSKPPVATREFFLLTRALDGVQPYGVSRLPSFRKVTIGVNKGSGRSSG